jgi:hypothetical protein
MKADELFAQFGLRRRLSEIQMSVRFSVSNEKRITALTDRFPDLSKTQVINILCEMALDHIERKEEI